MDPQISAMPAHTSVLLHETVSSILGPLDGIYLDATYGRGGHTRALLSLLGPKARVIALDRDPTAIAAGQLENDPRLTLVHSAFSSVSAVLSALNIPKLDGMMLDIGVSSPQLDEAARGFSFSKDAPLDMRMDDSINSPSQTAAQWVAAASINDIKGVLHELGEERHAARIAALIVQSREIAPITTTGQLAQLVERAIPFRQAGHHPATRTFQAIRIHINQELDELVSVLKQAQSVLTVDGKLAVISFHSLEDRIVKQAFRPAPVTVAERHLPRPTALHPWRELSRIRAGADECKRNPRARSATLRVAIRQATEVQA